MTSKMVAVATAAALALYSGPAGASTAFFVATTGTDSATCGPAAKPCKTIQFTLDKAAPGDTVNVRAGTYAECVLVAPGTGVGGVTLENEGFDPLQTTFGTILDGTGVCDAASPAPGPVVTVFDRSTVQGFTIKNGGDSDVVGLGAVTIATNKISAGKTTSIGGGIYLQTGANLTDATLKAKIAGNTIDSCAADLDGGGIYVDASATGAIPSVVEIDGNTISTNTAGGVGGAFGGGVTVFTDTASGTDVSTVTITANTITGNAAKNATAGAQVAYGGGIFVATGGASGLGTESVTVGGSAAGSGNIVRGNSSEGFGGGISINLQPVPTAIHSIVVERNAITSNTAAKGGGGIHAFATGTDLVAAPQPDPPAPMVFAATMDIEGNTLTGNHATGAPTDFGGGGVFSENYFFRTPTGVTSLQIARNSITSNDTTSFGGGVNLLLFASDDPNGDGVTSTTDATMEFTNNLLAKNAAHDTGGAARGGGAYQYVEASGGQASATLDNGFLTVANNTTDVGEAGLGWDAVSSANSLSTDGQTQISLSNSIVSANAGVGVGGGVLPGPGVGVDIRYDDSLGNTGGDWDAQLGVAPGTNGILAVDPALDVLFVPALCSPTIDAGDPATPVGQEILPNGNRVNLGHLGGTVSAIRTLPDVNGDGHVDGLDVLAIAVSFSAASGDPRFSAAADRDFDSTVDGHDLSYVAAFYGQSCP